MSTSQITFNSVDQKWDSGTIWDNDGCQLIVSFFHKHQSILAPSRLRVKKSQFHKWAFDTVCILCHMFSIISSKCVRVTRAARTRPETTGLQGTTWSREHPFVLLCQVLQRTDGNKDGEVNPSLISILRTSALDLEVGFGGGGAPEELWEVARRQS